MRAAAAIVLVGQSAHAMLLDLPAALAFARTHNPALRGAAADIDAARGRRRQAGLLPYNPVVSGEGARHTVGGTPFFDGGVSIGQEIEVGGQRGLRLTAAARDVSRSTFELADRLRGVEGDVRRSFAGFAAADRRRGIAADTAALSARVLDTARRRLATGDTSAVDVDLAAAEAARTAQQLALVDTDRLRAATRLAAALGTTDATDLTVIDPGDGTPAPPAVAGLLEDALASRPDLLAARAEEARLVAQADVVHRGGVVPNVTLRGFYRREVGDEHVAGAEVAVPLPLWNREQGTEAALRADAVRTSAEADRLEQEVARQVQLAHRRLVIAEAAWDRYRRDGLPAVDRALARIEDGYRNGYLGLPEVLVQQDRLVAARNTGITAWLEVQEAEADLLEAVGHTEAAP
jgi:cobalt-zinc-cadmium efflux system outer membrane protein